MALDTEAKRWSMLAFANQPVRSHVFNPETSGLVSIEQITVLQYYGGIGWEAPVVTTPLSVPSDGEPFGVFAGVGFSNMVRVLDQGDSLAFFFDRSGLALGNWTLTINIKTYASDTALMSRIIALDPSGRFWEDHLTATETAALALGNYRLTGHMFNATTDESDEVELRFNITKAW